jgi:copper homeostasis protein
MPQILLEICCGSIDDAIESEKGGADRIELCSALFLGGLTPSIGTIDEAKLRLKIPVMVMVRPRAGGFCYTSAEMSTMERDATAALERGADGIVFGILTADGKVDLPRSQRIRRLIGDKQAVFHRAFDVTPEPFEALEQLIDMGITRLLTSGQKDTVPQGVELIRKLVERAAGRIEVLPGGGIQPYQVRDMAEQTTCNQIHLTAWKTTTDPSTHANPAVTFGGALFPPEDRYQTTDSTLVREIANKLNA